jgi:energy-coupling factor transporter ATP-binding protein EcfA2
MKLHSLKIQNFRAIENSQFDFTDNLSKPKKVNLIIGPNGSGKTSILDAILIVVRTLENPPRPHLRDALEFSVSQLVRGEAKQAKIEFEYAIEEDEAQAINDVFRAFNQEPPFKFKGDEPPLNSPACVTWALPTWELDDKNEFSVASNGSANTLGARGQIAKAVSKNRLRASLFERVGAASSTKFLGYL